jgi:hypothetical protein
MRLCPNPATNASVPDPSMPVWADGMFAGSRIFRKKLFLTRTGFGLPSEQLHPAVRRYNIM